MVAAVTAVRVWGQPAAGGAPGPSAEPGCRLGGAGSARPRWAREAPAQCWPTCGVHSGASPRGTRLEAAVPRPAHSAQGLWPCSCVGKAVPGLPARLWPAVPLKLPSKICRVVPLKCTQCLRARVDLD